MKIKGRVHVYARDHINTDEIIPARYLTSDDPAYLGQHVMEDLDPDFPRKVQPGDIIVAGKNFGTGSSREHAVWALKAAGVEMVIAESFANIFYRNAINNGFLIVELLNAPQYFETGDEVEVDLTAGWLKNLRTGEEATFTPLPEFAIKVREAGGYLEYLKASEQQ